MEILEELERKFKHRQSSYMMVTVLAMLDLSLASEIVKLDEAVRYFRDFYETRRQFGKKPEKEGQKLASISSMNNTQIKSLMVNMPINALSDFISYDADKEELTFREHVSRELKDENTREEVRNLAYEHLYHYYKDFDPRPLTLEELNDLPLGVAVTATDVASLSGQNQIKGIHPINKDGLKAVVLLCTIGGEHYSNEWLAEDKSKLKYYLEGRTDRQSGQRSYNPDLPSNKSIIDSREEGYPIHVFARKKKGELFHYAGKYMFDKLGTDDSGGRYFILKRKESEHMSLPHVSREEILKALQIFDNEKRNAPEWQGWESKKNQKYAISYQNRFYPPKEIISMATGVPVSKFSVGEQSNAYLRKRGFEVIALSDRRSRPSFNYRDTVHSIYEYIKAKGFVFEEDLLFNFFLSLKTKPFVILAGISGTGKTKLIELFAEAIGATNDNGRFELIPVRPDWNDSSDLLGYRNLEGKFQPGVLTRVIQRAVEDLSNPYFVCLDEMNLARVEYYFSDFLSLLETRRRYGGELRTNKVFRETDFVFQEDREEFADLYIPENMYIVGTVNMDETTHPFSKKVLDRANTIEFVEVALDKYGGLQETNNSERPVSEQIPATDVVSNNVLKSEYCLLNDCLPKKKAIVDEVVAFLTKVNDILQPANLHVGYRVRDEISFFMIYNQDFGLMDKDRAFDWQLLQKILPRIQGSSRIQNTNDYKLVETVARVMEKEGFAYFDNVDDIKDWLEDVINANNLQAIVFIWDEFTDYFRQNRAVSTLQELAHASSRMPFYLFLITHRAVEQFTSLDSDARRVLQDRFHMIKFQMSEVTAYQLMANAIKIKEPVRDEWETKLVTLWDSVERCAEKLKQNSEGLKIEDLKRLVPIHPFSAYLLSILSKQLSSNQRTMFQFLKEDASNQEEGVKHNFNWFIQNHTIDGWCWLTADFMWDYFFKPDDIELPEEVQRLINYYHSHCEELTDEELKIFKCTLLLIAMNRQLGAEKLLRPLQSNLELIFMGTPIYEKVERILDKLVEKDLLNSNHAGINDREFMVPLMSYDKNKLDNIRKQIQSLYPFEKCVETQGVIAEKFLNVYKLTGALNIRFVTKTSPLQNLKLRLNKFRSELEPYNLGVLFVIVKSDMELAKVDNAIKENMSDDGRIILVNVNQAFGEREWHNWIDARTRERYAQEMNDGPNARYYRDYAEKIIGKWIDKVQVTTMTAYFNGDYYHFSKLSGLSEFLEKISAGVYPYGSETVTKNVNLYKLSGYSKDAVLMGMKMKKWSGSYSSIVNSLKEDGFWQDDATFTLKPNHPVSMMKQKVNELMEGSNSVYVVDIWNALQQPPYGLAPSPIAAFLFGFLMKEYGNGGYYRDDGINAVPLSCEGLAEVIESVMKGKRNYDNYTIVKMKAEHELFCNVMKDAFKFTKEQASCPRDVKQNIRRYLTEKKYPFWSLKYYLSDQDSSETSNLKKIIEMICELISVQEESSELQVVEKAAELLLANRNLGTLLAQTIDIENLRLGMKRYIEKAAPEMLSIAEKTGIVLNQIIEDIRNRMSEDAHWLWQEDKIKEVLVSIEDEYRLLDVLNNFVCYKYTKLSEAITRVREMFEKVRLPWSVIKNYAGDVKDTFELLISFVYSDPNLINKKDLASRLEEQGAGIKAVLDNLADVFAQYLQNLSRVNLSNQQVSDIYYKLPEAAINTEIEQFKQVVVNLINELRVNQLMDRLNELWQEISGTSSPKEWSAKNGIPILWLPNISASLFLDVFKIINDRLTQDQSRIENAIATLEQNREVFAILHDKEKINEAFINSVAGDYAYLVRNEINLDTIRAEIINRFGNDVYDWSLKQKDISSYIQSFLAEFYKRKTYQEVLKKIDELSAEEAKEYLKELIRQEPLVGIKILQKN